jgi:AAA+ superfamily predicted ATPase
MNLVLTGNPGVGKTTFARLLFRLLRAHGVLKKDTFIEMNALELKGKYCGHTAPKVTEAVRSARGGALFLDEAYALCAEGGRKDTFSNEALHTLLTEIENNRTEVLVILAGYKDKMGHLLAQDPGLARRFPLRLDLPDYTGPELAQIAGKVALERFSFRLEDGLVSRLERHIEEEHRNEIRNHNASLAVGLVEQAVEKMTCRLIEGGLTGQDASSTLLAADFGIREISAEHELANREKAKIQQELDNIIGMEAPKEHLRQLQKRIEFVRMGGSPKILDACMNLVLTGNPGTGKTTFARLLFRFLRVHGVLKKDVFIERNALELKGEYCGQTAPKIKEIFEMAIGGCLFLDEAYSLANGDKFSSEAIRMLLTEVENHRAEVLVVLAGYEDKMADFFKADPGLARRFPHALKLPDYTAADIARITRSVAENRLEVPFEDGVEEALGAWLAQNMRKLDASKHNGGLATNLAEAALGRLADRATAGLVDEATDPQGHKLTVEDFAFQSGCADGHGVSLFVAV